jgi:hypothetical protein
MYNAKIWCISNSASFYMYDIGWNDE